MKINIKQLPNVGEPTKLGNDAEVSWYKLIQHNCGNETRAWDFDLRGMFRHLKCKCGEMLEFV